jgi:hypothetical protein
MNNISNEDEDEMANDYIPSRLRIKLHQEQQERDKNRKESRKEDSKKRKPIPITTKEFNYCMNCGARDVALISSYCYECYGKECDESGRLNKRPGVY